ncbi:MAG TPA: HAMP domain-containing sensor histidine kinase [Candidatus Limiplasma sp.]|nr:HAMP domain-containing sensor histidine kinase [Candidatus Limiplasma sp.]HRX09269.1 HAMP domain-containing sensor histidine kinase [Candidatus Limiplasma sp.]
MRQPWHQQAHEQRNLAQPKFRHMVFLFTLIFSAILALTMVIVTLGMFALEGLNIIQLPNKGNFVLPTVIWVLSSLAVGIFTAALVSHAPLRSFQKLMLGMDRLARGDYSVRLNTSTTNVGRKLTESFNTMAEELQNTEMLRSDFVNNFSHEFKTPIVSILGFAKLLKRTDLPQEKREEYLDIILAEATRLTDMSENVLNLARIEKQSILTDISEFNLSEQIRTCILLLQKKWEAKRQDIAFDEYEYHYAGNEELLKQVWINLLDNAVKFTAEEGSIRISMTQLPEALVVSVASSGEPIDGETRKRIFEKFYQGDTSHATEGTGLGLAIVQRIVQLHKGMVEARYQDGSNVFIVTLPLGQVPAES